MSHTETLETYLRRMQLNSEQIDANSWIVTLDNLVGTRVMITVDEPVVVWSTPIFAIDDNTADREALFRTLLEFNDELLHSAYGLAENQLVLSAAHPVETLDFNEFQAMMDDMSIGLDRHLKQLVRWHSAPTPTADAAGEAN